MDDGVDDDCNGLVEDNAFDVVTYYGDADGDGFGTTTYVVAACGAPEGFAADPGDCNDGDIAFHPGAPEEDCADPSDYNGDGSVGYADNDGDGLAACEECDDAAAEVNPQAEER